MIGADIYAVLGPVRGRNADRQALQTAAVSGDKQNANIWVDSQAPSDSLAQMQPGSVAARAGSGR